MCVCVGGWFVTMVTTCIHSLGGPGQEQGVPGEGEGGGEDILFMIIILSIIGSLFW